MTITDKQAMREKFEAWASTTVMSLDRSGYNVECAYIAMETRLAWLAWTAALEAAEAAREAVLPADERDKFEELMRFGGLDTTMYGNVYMDERVQTARYTWLKCHETYAAPSSAALPAAARSEVPREELAAWVQRNEDRLHASFVAGMTKPAPGVPEADERAPLSLTEIGNRLLTIANDLDTEDEASVQEELTQYARKLLRAGIAARAQSSAAPVSAAPFGYVDPSAKYSAAAFAFEPHLARTTPVYLAPVSARPSADDAPRSFAVPMVGDFPSRQFHDSTEAAKAYIERWCPDHVKDYIDTLRATPPADARDGVTPQVAWGISHDGIYPYSTWPVEDEDVCDRAIKRMGGTKLRIYTAPIAQAAAWLECSGDPACCPENEGYGCCKPNPAGGAK